MANRTMWPTGRRGGRETSRWDWGLGHALGTDTCYEWAFNRGVKNDKYNVSYKLVCKRMDANPLPPAALYNNPCSNHCQQGVECVNLTGGDGDGEPQKKSCPLLHRRAWSDRKITPLSHLQPTTSELQVVKKEPDTAWKKSIYTICYFSHVAFSSWCSENRQRWQVS